MTKRPRSSRGTIQAGSLSVKTAGRSQRTRSTAATNAAASPTRKAARAAGARPDASLTPERTGSPPASLLEEEEQIHGRGAQREEVAGAQGPGAIVLGGAREVVGDRDRIAVQVGAAGRAHVHEPVLRRRADQPADELGVKAGDLDVQEGFRRRDAKPGDRHADADELGHLAADEELFEIEADEAGVVGAEPEQVVARRQPEKGLFEA